MSKITLPKVSMVEYLYNNNKDFLENTALIYQERKITFKEMFDNISIVCDAFKKNGVKKGDIVTVLPVNTPEFVYIYYGLNMLGAIVNSIHPLSSIKEIVKYLNEVSSEIVICTDVNCHTLHSALKDESLKNRAIKAVIAPITNSTSIKYKLKCLNDKVLIENSKKLKQNRAKTINNSNCFVLYNDFVKFSAREYSKTDNHNMMFEGEYEDVAVIVHTGGTTGIPKGAMISNKNGVSLVTSHIIGQVNYNRNQVGLANISIYTSFGFFDNINVPLSLGIAIILEPVYSPETFIKDIKNYKPNILLTVPAFIEAFIEKEKTTDNDYSFLDVIIVGGQKNVEFIVKKRK